MVSFNLTAAPAFPNGTTLKVYEADRFAGPPPQPGSLPAGPVATTANVEPSGFAVVKGVLPETRYYVGASVGGAFVWKTIVTGEAPAGSAGEAGEVNLGVVSGKIRLHFGEATGFVASLSAPTDFQPDELPAYRDNGLLVVTTNGHPFTIIGLTEWVNGEPEFGNGTYVVSLLVIGGALYAVAGLQGAAGAAGNTILFGEAVPAEGLGENGNFYIRVKEAKPFAVYGPKTGGAWGAATELRGPAGVAGPAGEDPEVELGIWLPYALGGTPFATSAAAIGAERRALLSAFWLPKGEKLEAAYVWNDATVSGNLNMAIFDNGQTTAGKLTPLAESGPVAVGGASAAQRVWTPKLATAEVGRWLYLAVMCDNAIHQFGVKPELRTVGASALGGTRAGSPPRMVGAHTMPEFAKFVVIAEAGLEAASKNLCMWGSVA